MKYIEEIVAGDSFHLENKPYLATYDFKNSGSRLCYSLIDGHSIWLKPETIVYPFQIYGLDTNNNIYPIKSSNK